MIRVAEDEPEAEVATARSCVIALTVPSVPTGMKTGVWMVARGSRRTPRRAPGPRRGMGERKQRQPRYYTCAARRVREWESGYPTAYDNHR